MARSSSRLSHTLGNSASIAHWAQPVASVAGGKGSANPIVWRGVLHATVLTVCVSSNVFAQASCPTTSPKFSQVRTATGRQAVAAIPTGPAFDAQVAQSGGPAVALAAGRDALTQENAELRAAEQAYAAFGVGPCVSSVVRGTSAASAACAEINSQRDAILVTEGMIDLLTCRVATRGQASYPPVGARSSGVVAPPNSIDFGQIDRDATDERLLAQQAMIERLKLNQTPSYVEPSAGASVAGLTLADPFAPAPPSTSQEISKPLRSPGNDGLTLATSTPPLNTGDASSANSSPGRDSTVDPPDRPDVLSGADPLADADPSAIGDVRNDPSARSADASTGPSPQDCEAVRAYQQGGMMEDWRSTLLQSNTLRDGLQQLEHLRSELIDDQPAAWRNWIPEVQLVIGVFQTVFPENEVAASAAQSALPHADAVYQAITTLGSAVAVVRGDAAESVRLAQEALSRDEAIKTAITRLNVLESYQDDVGKRADLRDEVRTQLERIDRQVQQYTTKIASLQADMSRLQAVNDAIEAACGTGAAPHPPQ